MPIVAMPDGAQVSFPDDMPAEQIRGMILQKFPQAGNDVNPVADIAKSAGVGLAKGGIGVAGMIGDARSLLSSGVSAATDAMGLPQDKVQQFKNTMFEAAKRLPYANALTAPGSQEIQKGIEGVTGEFYKPKTTAGEYAQTAAEFLPNLAVGPGGVGRKLLTNVAAPAFASETAGQLTKGTEAEPYARIAGALAGGSGAAKASNVLAERAATRAAPTTEAIRSATSNTYDNLTSRNVATPIAQTDLTSLADDITTALNRKGVRPSTASQIHAAVDEIRSPATQGAADVADLVAARQNIKSLLGSPDANKTGAFIALGKVEKEIERLSPGTIAKIREADKNWAVVKANEALDKRMAGAELRAAGENSGLNLGNRIRQNVTNYLLSNEAKYLNKQQRADLEKVVRGTASQNIIRWASNLMGGGGGLGSTVLGLGGLAVGSYTGNPALALMPVGGLGLRAISNRLTAGQAANSAARLRSSSPHGRALNLPNPQLSNPAIAGILAGLLSTPRN